MIFVLALGLSACIALPIAAVVGVALWIRSYRQGRRLDRQGGGQLMGLCIALGIVALIFVGEGLAIVAFLFAVDDENHNPATVDLEDA